LKTNKPAHFLGRGNPWHKNIKIEGRWQPRGNYDPHGVKSVMVRSKTPHRCGGLQDDKGMFDEIKYGGETIVSPMAQSKKDKNGGQKTQSPWAITTVLLPT
jgi:hypothetical protein